MERYRFEESALRLMEASCIPFAVYQFVDRRVVTLALSQGFCDLFGFDDRDEAYFVMDNDMYRDTHPDDVSRIANAAVRFATEGGRYEVVYRSKAPGASEFSVVHSFGEHVYTPDGVRLAVVWYTDEGVYERDGSAESPITSTFNRLLREASQLREGQYDSLTGLPRGLVQIEHDGKTSHEEEEEHHPELLDARAAGASARTTLSRAPTHEASRRGSRSCSSPARRPTEAGRFP